MNSKKHACTISGLRPHKLPGNVNLMGLMAALERAIRSSLEDGCTTFLTGAAMGVDLWAAQMVLDLKKECPEIKLICCLPCKEQSKAWPENWKVLYEETLLRADEVICLQESYSPGCMQRRNMHMLAHCSRLIAVHDGITKGGTLYTLSQAKKQGLQIIMIDPARIPDKLFK